MLTINTLKVSEFRAFMGELGKQKSTLESYSRDIRNFIDFLAEQNIFSGDVSPQVLEQYKCWLLDRGSKPSSIRRAVIAIRVFFRWLQTSGQLPSNPMEDLPVPGHEQTSIREISNETVTAILSQAQLAPSAIKSARDIAIIYLISREGLKASELVKLRWSNFLCTGESGRLSIPGDRARTIALEADTTHALRHFRKTLQNDTRTKNSFTATAPMLLSFKGADARSLIWGITRHGLKFAIYELGESASIKHLNAEQLRHLAMSHKLSLGFTPEMVMNHLGLRRVGNIGKHLSTSSP
jgi:site-specific recombinase XerD